MKSIFLSLGLISTAAAASTPALEPAFLQAHDRVVVFRTSTTPAPRATPDADSDVEPLEDLGNFHKIGPGLYRSAQPSRAGYKQVKSMGVRTILTLKKIEREREDAGSAGLAVENVPMSGFSAPSFEQMDRALAIMTDPAKRPLLVHCQFGKDRTGFVVAAYRTIIEGVDDAKASEEAFSRGCCFAPFGDLKRFLKDYRRHRQTPKP